MTQRPNILIIMTDQQSAKMMGRTGNRYVLTPNIDRIARSGFVSIERIAPILSASPVTSA